MLKLVLCFLFFPFYLVILFLARQSEKKSDKALFGEFDDTYDFNESENSNPLVNSDLEQYTEEPVVERHSLKVETLEPSELERELECEFEFELECILMGLDDELKEYTENIKTPSKKSPRWTPEDEAKWQAEDQRKTEHYENHVLTREYFIEKDIAPIPWNSFFGTDEWDIPSQAIYELIEEEKEGKLIIPENTEDRKRLRQNLEQEIYEYEQASFAELPMIQRWGRTSEGFMKRISPFLK